MIDKVSNALLVDRLSAAAPTDTESCSFVLLYMSPAAGVVSCLVCTLIASFVDSACACLLHSKCTKGIRS